MQSDYWPVRRAEQIVNAHDKSEARRRHTRGKSQSQKAVCNVLCARLLSMSLCVLDAPPLALAPWFNSWKPKKHQTPNLDTQLLGPSDHRIPSLVITRYSRGPVHVLENYTKSSSRLIRSQHGSQRQISSGGAHGTQIGCPCCSLKGVSTGQGACAGGREEKQSCHSPRLAFGAKAE